MKEENNNIDKLFREGSQKHYPYDENLWAQVENKLPSDASPIEKSRWRNMFKTLLVLAIILFLETDSIISHNHYVPRSNNEQSVFTKISNPEGKIEEVKKQTAPKTIKYNGGKESKKTELTLNNKVIQEQSTTSPIQEEKQFTEATKNATSQKTVQQAATNSVKADEKSILAQADVDDFDPKKSLRHSELDIDPNLMAESSLPTIGEMSRLSSMGFQEFLNFSDPLPLENETNKLNELQQKFKKRVYYVELEYARSFIMDKQISALEATHKDYRSQAENSRFQQSMGVNILTDLKKFTVGLGIHKSSFHERLSYTYNEEINRINVSYDTSYTIVNGNFNSNGTPVILIRENIHENRTETTENVDKKLLINNQFQRISLPLSLGYTHSFGRFNVGLRTALVLNYLYSSSGGYISNNRDNFYAFDEKEQLEDWMIGNRNQLRLGYAFNEFVLVGTSVNHEHDLTSFTKDYSSKFNSYGMGFWLVYRPR